MDDLARVRSEINRYCDLYFICPRFEPSELVTIDDLRQKKRGVPWPNGDEAGCYVMYSEHGGLLYIGLARHISARLNQWFRYNKRQDQSALWTSSAEGNWNDQPKRLQTIKVNYPYEAPSLEAFLIGQLDPPENIHMKHRSDFAEKFSS